MRTILAAALAIVLSTAGAGSAPLMSCTFDRKGWDPEHWVLVKSPRGDHFGTWVQKDGHIENAVPADATAKELLGKRASETYTSMVWKDKVRGEVTIRVTLAFVQRMAPLIVLAPTLGRDAKGRPEYREHLQVVLYDKGVNVWHHFYENDRPSHKRAAYARFPLKADTPYVLEVKKRRKNLQISVAGHTFGYRDESLPDEFYVGITGCEGVNKFYKMEVLSAPR